MLHLEFEIILAKKTSCTKQSWGIVHLARDFSSSALSPSPEAAEGGHRADLRLLWLHHQPWQTVPRASASVPPQVQLYQLFNHSFTIQKQQARVNGEMYSQTSRDINLLFCMN